MQRIAGRLLVTTHFRPSLNARPSPSPRSKLMQQPQCLCLGLFPTCCLHRSWLSTKAPNDQDLTLFVACLPGIEAVLSNELSSLGIPHSPTPGGANIRRASTETILQCNLLCGSASHVLLRCGRAFNIQGFADLSRKVTRIPWHLWLRDDANVQVRATCAKSKIFHTGAVQQRVEAAIDKALDRTIPGTGPPVVLTVRIHRDVVQLSIDTSLTPLHRRGYRLETAKAPLREDIAYSMLYAAGIRDYQGLIDPLCGSGTVAIEGAAMKMGLPPGRLRDVPMEGTAFYSPELWNGLLNQALEASEKLTLELGSHPLVMAGDRDEGAVRAAIANAQRAGVIQFLDISARSLSDHDWFASTPTRPESVLIATNPPFGRRISKSRNKAGRRFDELLPLYQTLGNKVSGMKGEVGTVVLTNNVDLARRMGLKDTKALFSTKHGGLPVAAMGSNLKNPILADSVKIVKE
jgi:putative N6-adenine-specific DNA methylase